MGKTTIEWAQAVWNPVTGCTKVSAGCKHCYAKSLHDMRHRAFQAGKRVPTQYGQPFEQVMVHENRLEAPLHWRVPRRVFVNSMSDLFHERVDFSFLLKVFAVMEQAKQHTFIVLTKRTERMVEFFQYAGNYWWPRKTLEAPRNVWLGISAEDQKAFDTRYPLLLQTPASVHFVSFEPLLSNIDLSGHYPWGKANGNPSLFPPPWKFWAIVGGESGPNARPMNPAWARSLRDQCVRANVPFFFKQHGEWLHESQIWDDPMAQNPAILNRAAWQRLMYGKEPLEDLGHQWEDRSISYRVGKKAAGRALDGLIWDEFPRGRRGENEDHA